MERTIICDTSCLLVLEEIKKLDILREIFTEIITTPQVEKEFEYPLPEWIRIQQVSNYQKQIELLALLDLGEASAIALAFETPNSILIIDEKKGRLVAKDLNLKIIGTLRVILLAKQKGILKSVKETIRELKENGFWLSEKIVNKILSEADEEE